MPETRYIRTFEDGVLISEEPYEVSDEQILEEQERKAMKTAGNMIDAISTLKEAKTFLKKLCKRLFANRALP